MVVKLLGARALGECWVLATGPRLGVQNRNCNQRETPISSAGDAVSTSSLPHPLPLNSATPAKAQGLFESQLENQVP